MILRSIVRPAHLALATAVMTAWLIPPHPASLHAQEPFAPPAAFAEQFQESGGWLGISIEEVSADKAKELKLPGVYGVLVTQVGSDSPAAKAGLKNGDVITDYNGQRVEGTIQFRRLVRETPSGHTAQMSVWRNGRTQKLSAEAGKAPAGTGSFLPDFLHDLRVPRFGDRYALPGRPAEPREGGPGRFGFRAPVPNFRAAPGMRMLGISVQDLSGQLGSYFGVPDNQGVLVASVQKDSAADKAGLKAGDVITQVDGNRVRNTVELRDQLRDKREAQSVTLGILRKGTGLSIPVTPDKPQSRPAGPGRRIPI
jgi:serine protease Do